MRDARTEGKAGFPSLPAPVAASSVEPPGVERGSHGSCDSVCLDLLPKLTCYCRGAAFLLPYPKLACYAALQGAPASTFFPKLGAALPPFPSMQASARPDSLHRPCFPGWPNTESGPTCRGWADGQAQSPNGHSPVAQRAMLGPISKGRAFFGPVLGGPFAYIY